MKNVTIELTYGEIKTIYRALNVLLASDKEQLQRKLWSEGAKKNIEHEMETCMELLDFDGTVYEAWKEAHKEEK